MKIQSFSIKSTKGSPNIQLQCGGICICWRIKEEKQVADVFTCCWTLQIFNGWSDGVEIVRRAYGFYSLMLLTSTAITLSSPPRHSQVFNGGFIISITFDHKLAKFGMYILSCVSQQTNLWLRFSEFLLSWWQTSCTALWICPPNAVSPLHSCTMKL